MWVPEHSHPGEPGNDFLEQFQPFASQLRAHLGQSRDVAPGSRQALDEPTSDRVARNHHDDRNCPAGIPGSHSLGSRGTDDKVNLETYEIGCENRERIATTLRIAIFDADILALNPPEVAQTQPECLVPERGNGRRE